LSTFVTTDGLGIKPENPMRIAPRGELWRVWWW